MSNYKENLKHITTFVFDYDGVLTDGKTIIIDNGEGLRTANVRDGYAMQYAIKKAYRIVVISGGRSEAISRRFKALDVHDVFMGVSDKVKVYSDYLKKNKLKKEEILFMGDDIPDYPLMKLAGIAACPANASEEIKSVAAYISNLNGGDGCVRDVIEQVLKVQGNWFDIKTAFHW
jgi:3-deoxy-D-manno-octulosonate 8-phosphate phosphatase (KDO 8-P phosphatase)